MKKNRLLAGLALIFAAVLLSGCSAAQAALDEAYALRDEYAAAERLELTAEVTADYGACVYLFTLRYAGGADAGELSVLAPECVAGLAAAVDCEDGITLLWDGAELYAGALDSSGLSPADAFPALIACWSSGAITEAGSCLCMGEDALRVEYALPEGQTAVTWFGRDSGLPLLAEIDSGGCAVIVCQFQNVIME
jgi:hypothetical protein